MAKSSNIISATFTLTNKVNFPGDDGTPVIVQNDDDTSAFQDYIDPVYGNMDFEYDVQYNVTFSDDGGDSTWTPSSIENVSVEIIAASPDVTDSKYPYPVPDIGIIDFTILPNGDIHSVKNNIEPFPGQSYRVLKSYIPQELETEYINTVLDEPVVDDVTDYVNFTVTNLLSFYESVNPDNFDQYKAEQIQYKADLEAELALGQDIEGEETDEEWAARLLRIESGLSALSVSNILTLTKEQFFQIYPYDETQATRYPSTDKKYIKYSEQEADDVDNYEAITEWRQPDVKQFTITIRVSGTAYETPLDPSPEEFYFDMFQLIDWHYIPALNRLQDLVERGRI